MKIYHGVILKNYNNMLKNGIRPDSYWGSKALALQYSDCNKVIEIDTNDYVFDIIPNETLVEHFAINDVDSEKYNN